MEGKSGCALAWMFYFPNNPTPKVVDMMGDYDLHIFNYGNDSRYLNIGIREYNTKPTSKNWMRWLDAEYTPYKEVNAGRSISRFLSNYYERIVKVWGFGTLFEGYKAIACNDGGSSSDVFGSINKERYDIMLLFVFDGRLWFHCTHVDLLTYVRLQRSMEVVD